MVSHMHDTELSRTMAELETAHNRHNPGRIIAAGLVIVAAFFGGFALWACLAPLQAAVHAQGEVIFDSRRKTVQHLEGGIVKQILVREGESITAGQPLIVLDDEMVRPAVSMMEDQSISELATIARLEAEKNGLDAVVFPAVISARANDPVVQKIMQTEAKLFMARRDSWKSQVQVLESQIQQAREEIAGFQALLKERDKEISSLKEQLDSNRILRKDGYVTKTAVLELERMLAEKSGSREKILADIAQSGQRMKEYDLRIAGLTSERIKEAVAEMKLAMSRRMELEEKVRPSRNTLGRQVIRAPLGGRVVDLKVTTVGGVIAAREPLMDIAPSSDHLILQARIGVNDIHDVTTGQGAEVTLTAYKASTTPRVKATVTYISADRLTERTMQGEMPYYTVHLELDPQSLKNAGNLAVYPGMAAEVSITTKARTAFDYFIGPLKERMGKAFHEK